jgi:alpha-glucosidase
MPWTVEGPSAGFSSTAKTWLPLDDRHRALAADKQEHDRQSMLAFARSVIAMRREDPILRQGAGRIVEAPEGVLAFLRQHGGERRLCVFELAGAPAQMPVHGVVRFGVTGAEQLKDGVLTLPPFGGAVLAPGPA